MISITRIFEFEASHHLPQHLGACRNLHGHSYKLEVTVTGVPHKKTKYHEIAELEVDDDEYGMVMDFKNLKNIVTKVIGKYDHCYLNDYFPNPTAETMVESIAHDIIAGLPKEVTLVSCKLWETSNSYAEYNPYIESLFKEMRYQSE